MKLPCCLSSLLLAVVLALSLFIAPAQAGDIPLIDAHSQLPKGLDAADVALQMDKAGVRRTILSARNDRKPLDVLALAQAHPERITAAVRTKGKEFNTNDRKYYGFLKKQLNNPGFAAMAEVLLYHAKKGNKAPEIAVMPDEPQAVAALDACRQRGWPFIAHIEFAAAGSRRGAYMKGLEALLQDNPDLPVLLIHMGQLDAPEAARLLAAHPNLHFMTSHCNPVSAAEARQPWTRFFEGEHVAPAWRELLLAYPDRFVLAFDNVWPEQWGDFYLREAALWQRALAELPPDAAHALAHGNAERLWHLPPVQ